MSNIEKIRDDLYVKKDMFGYRVVHPFKKDIDKLATKDNINWFNLLTGGGWWSLTKSFLVLIVVLLLVVSYKHDIRAYKEVTEACFERPCEWCKAVTEVRLAGGNEFNMSVLNFSLDKNG